VSPEKAIQKQAQRFLEKQAQGSILTKIRLVSQQPRSTLEQLLGIVAVDAKKGTNASGDQYRKYEVVRERSPALPANFIRWVLRAYQNGWLSQGDLTMAGLSKFKTAAKPSDILALLDKRSGALKTFISGVKRFGNDRLGLTSAGEYGGTTIQVRDAAHASKGYDAWRMKIESYGYRVVYDSPQHGMLLTHYLIERLEAYAEELRAHPIWGPYLKVKASRYVDEAKRNAPSPRRATHEERLVAAASAQAESAATTVAAAREAVKTAIESGDKYRIAATKVSLAVAESIANATFLALIAAEDALFEPPPPIEDEQDVRPYESLGVCALVLVDDAGQPVSELTEALDRSEILLEIHRQDRQQREWDEFLFGLNLRRKGGALGSVK